MTDVVARVRAALDAKDTEIERLRAEVARLDRLTDGQVVLIGYQEEQLAALTAKDAEIERLQTEIGRWKAKVDQIIAGVTPADIGMIPVHLITTNAVPALRYGTGGAYSTEFDPGDGWAGQLWRLSSPPPRAPL